jgi:hypothetical protein
MLERCIVPHPICELCGKTATRPWWSFLTFFPFLIGFLFVRKLITNDFAVYVAPAAAFVAIISCSLDIIFVPLIKKKQNNAFHLTRRKRRDGER